MKRTRQMDEPSVLDFIKAKLSFGRIPVPEVPPLPAKGKTARARKASATPAKRKAAAKAAAPALTWPWRSLAAFAFFLIAQAVWNGGPDARLLGAVPALLGLGFALWAAREAEWQLPVAETGEVEEEDFQVRRLPLLLGLIFFGLAFIYSSGNRFTLFNVTLWEAAVIFTLGAFWRLEQPIEKSWAALWKSLKQGKWSFSVSWWGVLVLGVALLAAFFRFTHLAGMPPEMLSDHAEKLLDVYDIQHGMASIFFPRNTGREPLEFYLADLVSRWFGTGLNFITLKLVTTILAFASLPYMYLLGKELGGRRVGLLALVFMGISYWPNVLARTGLRFSMYATFAAPTLYYLLLALRRGRVNDYLLTGLFLGASLYGYTASRIMPFVVGALLLVYLLHRLPAEQRSRALTGIALAALVALVVFTPLLRYALEEPSTFAFRMNTRLLPVEQSYPGSPLFIFIRNVWHALGMVNLDAGNIWLVGLLRKPALDLVSAALFLLGVILVALRYARQRDWRDLALLLSVPLLMLPSILSLVYPDENPALNRAGGAAVAIFLICAIALDSLLRSLREKLGGKVGPILTWGSGVLIVLLLAGLNYKLVFHDYYDTFRTNSWNSSEMGAVVADYAGSIGRLDSAWVVAYPYWVDTRLVAISAGFPGHDYGIWPDGLDDTLSIPAPKLFLLKPEDTEGQQRLQAIYPEGTMTRYLSNLPTHDFLIYFVPATGPTQ